MSKQSIKHIFPVFRCISRFIVQHFLKDTSNVHITTPPISEVIKASEIFPLHQAGTTTGSRMMMKT
jgi:hypothetical protein